VKKSIAFTVGPSKENRRLMLKRSELPRGFGEKGLFVCLFVCFVLLCFYSVGSFTKVEKKHW